MNIAMLPAYSSGMRNVTARKYATDTMTAVADGHLRRKAIGTARIATYPSATAREPCSSP